MSTCLNCTQWEAKGVPRYAADMGMAFCLAKRTRAVTLSHLASCQQWQPATQASVDQRVAWLKRRGIDPTTPRSGSFQQPSTAGHSQPDEALVHGVGKWWTVDGGRWTTEVDS